MDEGTHFVKVLNGVAGRGARRMQLRLEIDAWAKNIHYGAFPRVLRPAVLRPLTGSDAYDRTRYRGWSLRDDPRLTIWHPSSGCCAVRSRAYLSARIREIRGHSSSLWLRPSAALGKSASFVFVTHFIDLGCRAANWLFAADLGTVLFGIRFADLRRMEVGGLQ